jgi:hypothetical protein
VDVEQINGNKGELTVSVDGQEVFKKGQTLPGADELLAAVRKASPQGAGV